MKDHQDNPGPLIAIAFIVVLSLILLAVEMKCFDQERQIGELTLRVQIQREFLDSFGFKQAGFPKRGGGR